MGYDSFAGKLKELFSRRLVRVLLFAALMAFLLTAPLYLSKYILHVLITCFVYSCLTLSLNLVIGWSGQFSLGHVCFYGMGAYVTTLLVKFAGVNFFLAVAVSVVVVAIFSALLCLPTLKLRGDYIAVVTLGFGEVFRLFLNNAVDLTRGPMGIPSIPKPTAFGFTITGKLQFYYFALVLVILFIGFMRRMNNSGFGLAMRTVKEDDVAATSLGINPVKYKLLAFVLGGGMAAIMGSFYAVYMGMIGPSSFSYAESIKMVSMVVLGGMGSVVGSVLGAVLLAILPEALRAFSEYRMVIFGAAMVLMMIFKPNGLWGSDKRLRNEYKITAFHNSGRL